MTTPTTSTTQTLPEQATSQMRHPNRADRQHCLNSLKALENLLDLMADDLRKHMGRRAQSPILQEDMRRLGLLHKASGMIYTAHATFLELKGKEPEDERSLKGTQ